MGNRDVNWIQLSNYFMDRNSLKIHFKLKAKYHRLVFDKIMQKYLENECDFEVPIVIRQLIENYYSLYTIKKVQNVEFDILKRIVELTADKYSDNVIIGSLASINKLFDLCGSKFLQCCIDYGLLEKIKQLLSSNRIRIIENCLPFLVKCIMATNLYIIFKAGIVQIIHSIALNHANNNKNVAYLAIYVLFVVLFKLNAVHRSQMYKKGIAKVLFKVSCAVIDEIVFGNDLWIALKRAAHEMYWNEALHQDQEISEIYDAIKQHIEKCDQSKIKQENKSGFDDFWEFIHYRIDGDNVFTAAL